MLRSSQTDVAAQADPPTPRCLAEAESMDYKSLFKLLATNDGVLTPDEPTGKKIG
jgi:hypothetical protein